MKKIVLLLAIIAVTTSVHAQTRRIAHRSHGGTKHEKYDGRDGNYGNPPMIKVHLESGKDTLVDWGDSLAQPPVPDTIRPQGIEKRILRMEDIDQFGWVTGKLAG
jgi:hypothetical protein